VYLPESLQLALQKGALGGVLAERKRAAVRCSGGAVLPVAPQ
jgi:hypothetical protein